MNATDDQESQSSPPSPGSPAPDPEERRTILQSLIRRIFISQIVMLALILIFVLVGVRFPDRLGAFSLAFLCGAIGGSMSLLKRIRSETLEVLKETQSSLITTLMPLLYGGLLAAVTYILFLGCVLTGDGEGGLFTSNLFPKFEGLNCSGTPAGGDAPALDMQTFIQIKPQSIQDFAKLLAWCLLSGYSEKFVDGILRTLEKQSPR